MKKLWSRIIWGFIMGFETARTFIRSEELIDAAVHIGEKVYNKPYTDFRGKLIAANFTYKCSDGTIIHRPNHNIANILRSLHYLKPVLEYLKYNGNTDTQTLLEEINENEIKKILFMKLFYTSGRKNEVGFFSYPAIANNARKNAVKNFKEYFDTKVDKTPFEDEHEINHYADLLEKVYAPRDNNKDKAVSMILSITHELDILRCYPEKRVKSGLIHTLNKRSKIANNRDLQKLLLYAQRCIIATGDMLRTQYETQPVHGIHEETNLYLQLNRKNRKLIYSGNNSIVLGCKSRDDTLFKTASRVDKEGIKNTCNTLNNVVEPFFFHAQSPNIQDDQQKILAMLRSGDGALRVINGSPTAASIRFEMEQLVNSNYTRPLKKGHLAKQHKVKVDLKTKATTVHEEREYIPLKEQKAIKTPNDLEPSQKVSKQEDRGKPKNTVFQKKCSYSLIPKSVATPSFRGTKKERVTKKYVSVGFLHDVKEMHLHGEKYLWAADVRTSGIDGFFWLATEKGKAPRTGLPGLQKTRDDNHCKNLKDLKQKVNTFKDDDSCISFENYSEMLISGSIQSLKAISINNNAPGDLLTALLMQCVLRCDYHVERPIIILSGEQNVKFCDSVLLQDAFTKAAKRQQGFWRRILNYFYPSDEQRLLTAIKVVSGNQPFEPLIAGSSRKMGGVYGSSSSSEEPATSPIDKNIPSPTKSKVAGNNSGLWTKKGKKTPSSVQGNDTTSTSDITLNRGRKSQF